MANTFWNSIDAYLYSMPVAEGIAVVLSVLYLVLAARENIWCWPTAFASTLIYLYVFYDVSLKSEVVLQFFYLVMAVYGFYEWKYGKGNAPVQIRRFTRKQHITWILAGAAGSLLLGWVMKTWFQASFPYLDALVTVFSVITTFMVVYKVLENWIYWFVIDGLAIYLYWQKELYFTVLLFIVYEVLVILGYFKWKQLHLTEQTST